MNKPKIFAHCPAGCEFETVHKADFENSATFAKVFKESDGSVRVNPLELYKINAKPAVYDTIRIQKATNDCELNNPNCVAVGTDIFLLRNVTGATSSTNKRIVYKYDTVTETYSKEYEDLYDFTSTNNKYGWDYCVAIGSTIFTISKDWKYVGKYDTVTKTFTETGVTFPDTGSTKKIYFVVAVGTDIYEFSDDLTAGYGAVSKFDTITNTTERLISKYLFDTSWNVTGNEIGVAVGGDIFIIGENIQKYNIATNSVTTMPATGYSFNYAAKVGYAVGTDIYIFSEKDIYKYDTTNNTVTKMDISLTLNANNGVALGTDIYFLHGKDIEIYITTTNGDCSVKYSYTDNGEVVEYPIVFSQIPIDTYRNDFTFEIISTELKNAYTVLTLIYEINGIQVREIISGTSIDITEAKLIINGSNEIFIYNKDAKIVLETNAYQIEYDNSASGIDAENVQEAVDSLAERTSGVEANKYDKQGGVIDGDVTIRGDLNIEGEAHKVDAETVTVKSCFVVTNSENTPLASVSGLLIRTGTGQTYAITYDLATDSVRLGLGTYNETDGTFVYTEDAGAVATRGEDNTFTNNNLVVWSEALRRFVDSGFNADNFAKNLRSKTTLSTPLQNNDSYNLTATPLNELEIVKPDVLTADFACDIKFVTGATITLIAENITFKGRDCLANGTFDIQPNTNYYINFVEYAGGLVGFVATI